MESIASMKQLDRKSLHMVIQDLKEINSYQWIPTGLMWADTLTKEMKMHQDMREYLVEGNFSLTNDGINQVQCVDS